MLSSWTWNCCLLEIRWNTGTAPALNNALMERLMVVRGQETAQGVRYWGGHTGRSGGCHEWMTKPQHSGTQLGVSEYQHSGRESSGPISNLCTHALSWFRVLLRKSCPLREGCRACYAIVTDYTSYELIALWGSVMGRRCDLWSSGLSEFWDSSGGHLLYHGEKGAGDVCLVIHSAVLKLTTVWDSRDQY